MNVLNIGVLIYHCQKTIIFETRNAFLKNGRYVGVNFRKKGALQEFRKIRSYRAPGLGMVIQIRALCRNKKQIRALCRKKKQILAFRRKSYEAPEFAFFVTTKSRFWHIYATEGYPGPRNSSNQICVPILINLPENICQTNEKRFKISQI